MAPAESLNTHQKALGINLDPTSYGSFAEIGAGQEVVRWFLVVGGASGTVAKSISAYDKEVSDDLYGVWGALRLRRTPPGHVGQRMGATPQPTEQKSWIEAHASFPLSIPSLPATMREQMSLTVGSGLRFQLQPVGEPNDILLHINLRDPSNPPPARGGRHLGGEPYLCRLLSNCSRKNPSSKALLRASRSVSKSTMSKCAAPAFEGWDQRVNPGPPDMRRVLLRPSAFPHNGPPEPPIDVLHRKAICARARIVRTRRFRSMR